MVNQGEIICLDSNYVKITLTKIYYYEYLFRINAGSSYGIFFYFAGANIVLKIILILWS